MAFFFQNQQLFVDELPVSELAEQFGTPLYIYSQSQLIHNWQMFDRAFFYQGKNYPHLVCFAVKANSNLSLLRTLAKQGSGFDIVSGGELARVLKAGGKAENTVFSGVGKTVDEIRFALQVGIRCFNVESEQELDRIQQVAQSKNKHAPISLRINPDIDAHTHPYISTGLKENKFGISIEDALSLYQKAQRMPNLHIVGIDCHIGSQLTDLAPFKAAAEKMVEMVEILQQQGIHFRHIDFGGGLGVAYEKQALPKIHEYVQALLESMAKFPEMEVIIEPGRAICADTGILVSKVEYLKQNGEKHFAIMDTGMHHMLRPALYQAYMDIVEVQQGLNLPSHCYEVVGPICESSDFLGKARCLRLAQGNLIAMMNAGAYGSSMSSYYNTQPTAMEIMVNGRAVEVIKRRPQYEELWALEC